MEFGIFCIFATDISQELGMTYRKSARWPIVSVRLTSCILRQTLRMEIGMREHRQQDSLDFHPFSFYHVHLDIVIELRASLELYGNPQVFGLSIYFATPFEIQIADDFFTFVMLSFPKVVINGVPH